MKRPVVRAAIIAVGLALAPSACGTEPFTFLGTWTGSTSQVEVALYVDSIVGSSAYGRIGVTYLTLAGGNWFSNFYPGQAFADSLTFDLVIPANFGSSGHGRAIRIGHTLLVSYETAGGPPLLPVPLTRQ